MGQFDEVRRERKIDRIVWAALVLGGLATLGYGISCARDRGAVDAGGADASVVVVTDTGDAGTKD